MLIIRPVDICRNVSAEQIGWISDKRASSETGLLANHDYIDMRGVTLDDALTALEEESEIFERLELRGFDPEIINEIHDELYESDEPWAGFDLGTAAAIYALSVIGCVPISSCNGGCLGDHHALPHPSILLYAKREALPPLLTASEEANVGVVNNDGGMIEIYADDIRKFIRFAKALVSDDNL